MQIREAEDSDIPEILKVLKASLGEVSSKKTEEVWRFKHIDNPFGRSLVLIAEENKEIIGVRAFMRWQWQWGLNKYSAFRAVDTATHPNHQGKGIFKKLTLRALEIARENGDHFVFNTPNAQSKPGYIKMGWKEVNNLKIILRLLNPLKANNKALEHQVHGKEGDSKGLLISFQNKEEKTNRLFTPKDLEYLRWRYLRNPLQNYFVCFNKSYFIAGYVKKRKRFDEFRISEAIIDEKNNRLAKNAVLRLANLSGASVLSISANSKISFKTGIAGRFGPVLTSKNINLGKKKEEELLNLSNWNYSLGDLELF